MILINDDTMTYMENDIKNLACVYVSIFHNILFGIF